MLCVAVIRTPAGAEESLPDMPPAPHTPCMRLPDVGEVAQQGGLGLCRLGLQLADGGSGGSLLVPSATHTARVQG